ncbi:N-acetylglucosamine-6-phosphate deacetylase [Sulfitobacter sp. F26204]|uniref:N-acetylglucosamine-6-phosphate deacetylase n=1 Tax=Sulfitobacter sp. F26204 TaxID=2996014 RepID=UPI00225E3FE8|nr:N-acetylglucosamine-6-phosphate deacetylase [Sulfitobacter sp. F26204]MCX7561008.1 N-acetylglucosamine-6-phosphate deacetylase [Sulfitobacter sp. F26204]
MTQPQAFVGADVFDGKRLLTGQAVVVANGQPEILPPTTLSGSISLVTLQGGTFLPGFVDLQVNGGGGVMFNDSPDITCLTTIARAHSRLGTRAFLPTLITDTPAQTTAAIAAVTAAVELGVPGIIGLHLEGPHLSTSRKGAHDAALIRRMDDTDCAELSAAARTLPNLLITVAPESVTAAQISTLRDAGAIVFLGHSDCDFETAAAAFDAGAQGTTHLFNAMSQLTSRAPGLVGATLNTGAASCGLIADGIHVHPATIRSALAAKAGPGAVFLVTDAMACAGSDINQFMLNGRKILRNGGKLTLEDGTLAGADLDMARALRVMINEVGEPTEQAFARATSIPASLLRSPQGAGEWPDNESGLIYLTPDFRVLTVAELT